MNCCSQQRGLNQIFSPAVARHEAEQFRKHGLDKRDRQLLRAMTQHGVQGASVLEIGGGVGGLEIELLRAGAAFATDVDIAQAYVESARELARDLGYAAASEQRVLDFAHAAGEVEAADIVLMNRVVCCYPDMPALVRPAAQHARRRLALVFPREAWWMRLGVHVMNLGLWLLRRDFRFFVHPHDDIIGLVSRQGLRAVYDRYSGLWRMMIFERGQS